MWEFLSYGVKGILSLALTIAIVGFVCWYLDHFEVSARAIKLLACAIAAVFGLALIMLIIKIVKFACWVL